MSIRLLLTQDIDAYMGFRSEIWPAYSIADWETVTQKYFHNPHRSACPHSGLYGYFYGDKLIGIMGAYPFPITLNGELHPGHLLVDWFLLPRFRSGPAAGRLFQELVALPGRKFATNGSADSQNILAKRATKIPAVDSIAVISPVRTALGKLLRLAPYAVPSSLCGRPFEMPGVAKSLPETDVPAPSPCDPTGTAFVHRGPDFWRVYFSSRVRNGAFAIQIRGKRSCGSIVMNLKEAGPARVASLLALHVDPVTPEAAREVGARFRRVLNSLQVSILLAVEADEILRHFVSSTALYCRRTPTHWWAIPRPSDTFSPDSVQWWFTLADRDSHWGVVPAP